MAVSPVVSIIINNYNYARYLPDAIKSALQQTYCGTEVIVVDDGSRDESRQVIQSFGDAVKPVFKENEGQASSLNAGLRASSGDIVLFLDADDALLPSAAESIVKAFLADPELAKIQYRMEVIDAAGERSGVLKPDPRLRMLKGDIRRQILSFPFDIPWLPTSGNAFSMKALRAIMPIPESYGPVGADWYLTQLAPLYGTVEFIDQVLAYYRVHGANTYERKGEAIDLDQLRQTILYASRTIEYLKEHAIRLGLLNSQDDILSVSYVANRLISYKLDRSRHPLRGDTATGLCGLGIKAAHRRSDVSPAIRAAFAGWFVAMMVAPSSLSRSLAEQFLFPGRRKKLNKVIDSI